MDLAAMGALLDSVDTVVVVGCSADPAKAAHQVPAQLQRAGFRVIPVNPRGGEILGEHAYRNLAEVPPPVELVDVFRPSAEAPDVACQAAAAGARILWLQEGITSNEARSVAEGAGMAFVEDACIAVVRSVNRIVKAR